MKHIPIVIFIITTVFFITIQTNADLYRWQDENGVIHVSDTPPASIQNVDTIETNSYPSPNSDPAVSKPDVDVQSKEKVQNKVDIYTTSWCGYCKKAIAFMKSNHIEYSEYDIEKDQQAAARMRKLTGRRGVPFAIINGNKVYGFSKERYKQLLGLH